MTCRSRQLGIVLLAIAWAHASPADDEAISRTATELKRATPYETLAACQAFVHEHITEIPSSYG